MPALRGLKEIGKQDRGTIKHFTYICILYHVPRTFTFNNSTLSCCLSIFFQLQAPSIMKLIVAGSTGFVATEVIRQALSHPAVTSIMALGRRETAVPPNTQPGADPKKLTSVICEDFQNYSQSVKGQLSGADACIWYEDLPSRPPLKWYYVHGMTAYHVQMDRLYYRYLFF